MSIALNDVVKVTSTSAQPALQGGNFKTGSIFTDDTPLDPSLTHFRKYSGDGAKDAVGIDFGVESDTYKAVNTFLSQEVKPESFYIVLRETPVQVEGTLTFDKALTANCTIKCIINGIAVTDVPFTTDQETTMDNFATALGLHPSVDTAVPSLTPFLVMTIVAKEDHNLEMQCTVVGIEDPPIATDAITTTGKTIVSDLARFLLYKKDWFFALIVNKNIGNILGMTKNIVSVNRDFIYQTSDVNVANNVDKNVQRIIKDMSLPTMAFWHGIDDQYLDFGFAGLMYSYDPYVADAPFKTIVGVEVTPDVGTGSLTYQQVDNLTNFDTGINCNIYTEIGGVGNIFVGVRSNGIWFKEYRDIKYLVNEIQLEIFAYFRRNLVTFLSEQTLIEIQNICSNIGTNREISNNIGLFTPGTVRVIKPNFSDISTQDRANGIAKGYKMYGELAGSLVKVEIQLITSR